MTCFIFLVLFSNHGLIEEDHPSEKILIVEEEINGVSTDDFGNIEDLSRLKFIDEQCGNLKVINDDGELTRNINQKKKLEVFQ